MRSWSSLSARKCTASWNHCVASRMQRCKTAKKMLLTLTNPLLVIYVQCVWSVCLVVFCRIYDGRTDLWCAHGHRACRTIDFCYHPLQYIISQVRDLHISLTQSLLPICVVCMRECWKWINFWESLHWYRTCNRVCRPPTPKLNQVSNIGASRCRVTIYTPANTETHRNMETRKHRQ